MMTIEEGTYIVYQGPAYRIDSRDRGAKGQPSVLDYDAYRVIQHQEADLARKVPYPYIIVQGHDTVYVVEDDEYCKYAGICHVCRSAICDKKCIPDFARYN